MPIYEYRCEKCGVFEQTQRITEPALDRCPTCRRKVRRLISNTSFQLKGGGWYVTDYARAGKGGSPAEDGTSAAKDGAKDAAKDSAASAASSSESAPKKSESKTTSANASAKASAKASGKTAPAGA